MPIEYTKEQLWKLYEKLPQELKEAIFSSESADQIFEICTRNGISENNVSNVANLTGKILLGLLLLDDFEKTIKKELKLSSENAKKVSHEINRFIFYPVKESLASLHKIEVGQTNGLPTGTTAQAARPSVRNTEEQIPTAAPVPTIKKQDSYKETIE